MAAHDANSGSGPFCLLSMATWFASMRPYPTQRPAAMLRQRFGAGL